MASIATLTIDLVGKSAKLTAELKKANKNTKSWADKTRQMVGSSAKLMTGFGVAGVAALSAIYAKNAEFIDQQAKTADRLGVTTETLTGLQHAANTAGASNEELNKSLQTMEKNLGQVAATGTGEAKNALDAIGLSIEDIKSLSPDEQFKLIADRLSDVESQSEKVFIAQTLMGKAGTKMINVMAGGADSINALIQEAEDLGMTFSRIDAAKVEMANDAFDRAQKTTHSFGQTLATETAPLVGALADMWTDSAKEAGGFGVIAQQVVTKVAGGIGFLSDMGRGLQITFMLVRQAVAEVANGVVQMQNMTIQAGGDFLEMIGMDVGSTAGMQEFADSFSATTEQLGKELSDLSLAPMPSEKIDEWIANVQDNFQIAAENQVANKKVSLEDLLIDNSNDDVRAVERKSASLVEAARSQYQQIHDAQLQQEGREAELASIRYERKVEEMEQDIELLREKKLVTADIEAEYINAKEELEQTHKANLLDIDKNHEIAKNQARAAELNNYSSLFDGMAGVIGAFAGKQSKLYKGMFAASKAFSLAESAIKIQQGLANALSLPFPTNIPAFIQVGSMAAGIVGTIQDTTMPSFDGGGYTGDGARIGGVDGKGGMYAILHPQETVIDHTKGQSIGTSGGNSSTASSGNYINVNFNVTAGDANGFDGWWSANEKPVLRRIKSYLDTNE